MPWLGIVTIGIMLCFQVWLVCVSAAGLFVGVRGQLDFGGDEGGWGDWGTDSFGGEHKFEEHHVEEHHEKPKVHEEHIEHHVKTLTYTKKVPEPYPVHVEKKVPVKVRGLADLFERPHKKPKHFTTFKKESCIGYSKKIWYST